MFRRFESQTRGVHARFVVIAVALTVVNGSGVRGGAGAAGTSSHTIQLKATLVAETPTPNDDFGNSVAISGDWLIVGAPGDSSACFNRDPCVRSGTAYVYHRVGPTWQFFQKLRAGDPVEGARFGNAVGIDGDTIVVGAPNARGIPSDMFSGAAYVFVHDGSTWQEQKKLVVAAPSSDLGLGESVAISNNLVIAGAPRAASAFAFRRELETWTFDATFVPWDFDSDSFGLAVAVSEETVVVTSPGANAPGVFGSGAAYVFRRIAGTWTREAKVVPDLPISGSDFGWSVSLAGDRLAIGAFGEKALCQPLVCFPGATYVFARTVSSWTQETRIEGFNTHNANAHSEFGVSVALGGDYALIGADSERDPTCSDPFCDPLGAAYAYGKVAGNWARLGRLAQPTPSAYAYFGYSVAATPTTLVVSALNDGVADNGGGVVYVYRVFIDCNQNGTPDELDPDCNSSGTPDDCELADGASLDCNENSTPDECDIEDQTSSDCDANDVPDGCDLDNGTAPDCNDNDRPDSCDLVAGTSEDCNANLAPDECDISSGTSPDANGDHVPDECTTVHFVSALPAATASSGTIRVLSRTSRNEIRLDFDKDLSAPPPGALRVREMHAGGAFGPDFAAALTTTLADSSRPGVDTARLILKDNASNLAHRKWYQVESTGIFAGLGPFCLQFVVQAGDCDGSGAVAAADLTCINAKIPTPPATAALDIHFTDDINGAGGIAAADLTAANAQIPSGPVAKPTGHVTCP